MRARRLALTALLLATLAPGALQRVARRPAPARGCPPAGRGVQPRHWLGCAADPGPARDLADDERLLLGLPLDPNSASPGSLAFVPGLSRSLAAAIAEDRRARGPFGSVEELRRVHGIGPIRLSRARGSLEVRPR